MPSDSSSTVTAITEYRDGSCESVGHHHSPLTVVRCSHGCIHSHLCLPTVYRAHSIPEFSSDNAADSAQRLRCQHACLHSRQCLQPPAKPYSAENRTGSSATETVKLVNCVIHGGDAHDYPDFVESAKADSCESIRCCCTVNSSVSLPAGNRGLNDLTDTSVSLSSENRIYVN